MSPNSWRTPRSDSARLILRRLGGSLRSMVMSSACDVPDGTSGTCHERMRRKEVVYRSELLSGEANGRDGKVQTYEASTGDRKLYQRRKQRSRGLRKGQSGHALLGDPSAVRPLGPAVELRCRAVGSLGGSAGRPELARQWGSSSPADQWAPDRCSRNTPQSTSTLWCGSLPNTCRRKLQSSSPVPGNGGGRLPKRINRAAP